jgi:predicted enzyme related to lactoylglutathione lyase
MPRVVHFEIVGDDPEVLAKFYREVFGWKVQKWEGPMDYWLIQTGDEGEPGIDGGLGKRSQPGESTTNTIDVDDVDAFVAKIEMGGGKVVSPKHAVPGVGWLAYCEDPDGNPFGMMQADPEAG